MATCLSLSSAIFPLSWIAHMSFLLPSAARFFLFFLKNWQELCLSIKRGKRVDYVQAKPGLTRPGEQEKDRLSPNTKPPLAECSPLLNVVFDPCCYLHH